MWKGKRLQRKKPGGFVTILALTEVRIEIFQLPHTSTGKVAPSFCVVLLSDLIK